VSVCRRAFAIPAINAVLTFNVQLGWGYRVNTSTNLTNWDTNALTGSQRYWRLQSQEGGWRPD